MHWWKTARSFIASAMVLSAAGLAAPAETPVSAPAPGLPDAAGSGLDLPALGPEKVEQAIGCGSAFEYGNTGNLLGLGFSCATATTDLRNNLYLACDPICENAGYAFYGTWSVTVLSCNQQSGGQYLAEGYATCRCRICV